MHYGYRPSGNIRDIIISIYLSTRRGDVSPVAYSYSSKRTKLSLPVAGSRRVAADLEWDHRGTLDATAIIVDVIASLSSALYWPVNHEMSWQVAELTGLVWAATSHELRAINASVETTKTPTTRRRPRPSIYRRSPLVPRPHRCAARRSKCD